MMTNTSTVEVQFTNLTKAIKGLTKYLQDQDNQIVKLTDRVENVLDGASSHAPGKRPMVEEKGESCHDPKMDVMTLVLSHQDK